MLPRSEIEQYERSAPSHSGDLGADRASFGAFWARAAALRAKLPSKAKRNPEETVAAQAILSAARASRARFMRAHAPSVYEALTARALQRQKRAHRIIRTWRYIHIPLACLALLLIGYHSVVELWKMLVLHY